MGVARVVPLFCLSSAPLVPPSRTVLPLSRTRPASLSPPSHAAVLPLSRHTVVWWLCGMALGVSLASLSPLLHASPLCVRTVGGLCAAMPASLLCSSLCHRSDCAEHHTRFLITLVSSLPRPSSDCYPHAPGHPCPHTHALSLTCASSRARTKTHTPKMAAAFMHPVCSLLS